MINGSHPNLVPTEATATIIHLRSNNLKDPIAVLRISAPLFRLALFWKNITKSIAWAVNKSFWWTTSSDLETNILAVMDPLAKEDVPLSKNYNAPAKILIPSTLANWKSRRLETSLPFLRTENWRKRTKRRRNPKLPQNPDANNLRASAVLTRKVCHRAGFRILRKMTLRRMIPIALTRASKKPCTSFVLNFPMLSRLMINQDSFQILRRNGYVDWKAPLTKSEEIT